MTHRGPFKTLPFCDSVILWLLAGQWHVGRLHSESHQCKKKLL